MQASPGVSGNVSGGTVPTSRKGAPKPEKDTAPYTRSHPNASTSILYNGASKLFFCKGSDHILGFAGQTVSVTTLQLNGGSTETAIDSM